MRTRHWTGNFSPTHWHDCAHGFSWMSCMYEYHAWMKSFVVLIWLGTANLSQAPVTAIIMHQHANTWISQCWYRHDCAHSVLFDIHVGAHRVWMVSCIVQVWSGTVNSRKPLFPSFRRSHAPTDIDFSMTVDLHSMIIPVHECTHRGLLMMVIARIVVITIFHFSFTSSALHQHFASTSPTLMYCDDDEHLLNHHPCHV